MGLFLATLLASIVILATQASPFPIFYSYSIHFFEKLSQDNRLLNQGSFTILCLFKKYWILLIAISLSTFPSKKSIIFDRKSVIRYNVTTSFYKLVGNNVNIEKGYMKSYKGILLLTCKHCSYGLRLVSNGHDKLRHSRSSFNNLIMDFYVGNTITTFRKNSLTELRECTLSTNFLPSYQLFSLSSTTSVWGSL